MRRGLKIDAHRKDLLSVLSTLFVCKLPTFVTMPPFTIIKILQMSSIFSIRSNALITILGIC